MIIVFFGFILLFFKGSQACSCDGIEIELTDQKHCFQIIRNSGNSWVSADEKCSSIGGFLAHINTTTLYNELYDYISQNYQLPLITGATVANVELDIVAFMCPSNTFYSILSSSFVSSFFEGNPTTSNRCTFIVNNSTDKLMYMPCDTRADILCDRPMENTNYCDIKMNCTETTSTSAPSSTTKTSSAPITTTKMLITTGNNNLITTATTAKASNTTTVTTPTTVKLSTTSTTMEPNSTTTQSTTLSQNSTTTTSRPSTITTTSSLNSTTTTLASNLTTPTTTPLIQNSTTATTFLLTNSTTTVPQNLTTTTTPLPLNSSTTLTTTTPKNNSSLSTTTTSATLQPTQTAITNATTTTTTTIPIVVNSNSGSNSSSCGSGYTRVFGWCVPWWCWLIFGLLLLGLLLCCLSWLFHFCCAVCLCSHKKQRPIENIIEKNWNGDDAICQTDPMPPNETVYIPVPKTPPPEMKEPQIIYKEREPINTHTILHTHEIIHEKAASPPIPSQPPVIYDVTIYENTFNKNTILVPPMVQEPQPLPNLFFPSSAQQPQLKQHPKIFEDDIISNNSIPIFDRNFTPSPTPLYTKDETDLVPILPIAAMPTQMPVLAFKPKTKKPKKERKTFSPLKYNRPPIGSGQFEDEPPKPKKQFRDDNVRDFPKPPPRIIETPPERSFPKPPPRIIETLPERHFPEPSPRKRNVSPSKSPEPTFERQIRKNTPLNLSRQPERLSRTPTQKERSPNMPRLPTRLPFEVPSPEGRKEEAVAKPPQRKRAKSPPITIFEPPTLTPTPSATTAAPKRVNQRRVSPMNDEPLPITTSPKKFRSLSPNDISSKSMTSRSASNPASRRRRNSLEYQETKDKNNVSMRAARGRLGGADGKPEGWKPWAKSPNLFSGHPGFLDD